MGAEFRERIGMSPRIASIRTGIQVMLGVIGAGLLDWGAEMVFGADLDFRVLAAVTVGLTTLLTNIQNHLEDAGKLETTARLKFSSSAPPQGK